MSRSNKRERIVFVPDLQVPEHDPAAVALACKIIKGYIKPDRLIYLGDMLNLDMISSHAKWEPDVSISSEVSALQGVFKLFEKAAPGIRKQAIWGNHSRRWPKHVMDRIPELADMPEFSLERVIKLEENNIEGLFEKIELAGRRFVAVHGDPYAGSIPGSVARKWLDREGRSGICGHIHRLCTISKTTYSGTNIWTEGGSLCLNPQRWNRGHKQNWNLGFAWGYFGEDDFQTFEVAYHDNMSWIDPTGKEWRA